MFDIGLWKVETKTTREPAAPAGRDYNILTARSPTDLCAVVKKFLSDGWDLAGGGFPYTTPSGLLLVCQAVTRK